MESTSDRRFDPNRNAQKLLELAQERSIDHLLETLLKWALEHPALGLAQIWWIDRGDLCPSCPQRSRCADQTRCLHLAAGRGEEKLASRGGASSFNDPAARTPIGVGVAGQVAATGKEIVLASCDKEQGQFPEAVWLESEGVQSIRAYPMTVKGEVLGVIVLVWHEDGPDHSSPWGQIFANHVGAAIANARAFEEIRRLKAQLELQNAYLKEEVVEARAFGELVGQSAVLKKIVSQIDLVAPTEASVLILGDTGTGKELVAREIHRRSSRKDGPMVRVNCASVPKDLLESEFFGVLSVSVRSRVAGARAAGQRAG